MNGRLSVAHVCGLAELEALVPTWTDLWSGSDAATPFQAPAWILPWARTLCAGEALVLTAHDSDRLVGLLPLFVADDAHGRRLLPMAAGPSDYLDGVFADAVRAEAAAALLGAARRCDAIDLPQLPASSPLLTAPGPAGWSDERAQAAPCPATSLPATPSARLLQNLRRDRRRAESAGITFVGASNTAEASDMLETLFTLHAARWRRRGQAGVFADPAVRRFHRQAVPALARTGLLRLYALRREADGAILAVLYGMAAKRRFYYYIGGFDPDLAPLGLGTLLIAGAIEAAMREGAVLFDFLRGGESYKYRWGAADQQTFFRRLRAPT